MCTINKKFSHLDLGRSQHKDIYGNNPTYPIILVMSILEHVAQSQLCDLPNIVDKGRSTRKGKKIVS